MIWLGLAACLAWAVLLLGRGFFWLARDDDRDAAALPEPSTWPSVVAVVRRNWARSFRPPMVFCAPEVKRWYASLYAPDERSVWKLFD